MLTLARRLYLQKRHDKGKLYSVHAPEVECISKGKAHKRYEFGCKVSLGVTSKGGWVVAAQAREGNPYDGHTLQATMDQLRLSADFGAREQIELQQAFKGPEELFLILPPGSKTTRNALQVGHKHRTKGSALLAADPEHQK